MSDRSEREIADALAGIAAERLTSLTVEGFKAFAERQAVPLAPLTLIYGPNSAGKSSLLQALAVVSQSSYQVEESLLALGGPRVDVGSVRTVLFDRDQSRRVALGFAAESGDILWELRPELAADVNRFLVFRFSVDFGGKTLVLLEDASSGITDDEGRPPLRLPDDESAEAWRAALAKSAKEGRPAIHRFLEDERNAAQFRAHARRALFWFRGLAKLEAQVGDGFDSQEWPSFGEVASDVAEWIHYDEPTDLILEPYRARVRDLTYLGPLREPPSRLYVPVSGGRSTVGGKGQYLINVLNGLTSKQWDHLNDWLGRLEIPYLIDIARTEDEVMGSLLAVRLRSREPHRSITDTSQTSRAASSAVSLSPVDVGFGIGQVLPIVVEGLVGEARVICVEQPEIHLHPRLQAQLVDLLIDTAGIHKDLDWPVLPKQWIVETHSELMVQRVLRRIREGSVSPDKVSVVYVHPGKTTTDGAVHRQFQGSAVLPLRIDEEGRFIDTWPDGFFEENLREMLAS